RYLVARKSGAVATVVWDLEKGRLLGELKGRGAQTFAPHLVAVSPKSDRLAVMPVATARERYSVSGFSLPSLGEVCSWEDTANNAPDCLRFHPSGRIVALSLVESLGGPHAVQFWDAERGTRTRSLVVEPRWSLWHGRGLPSRVGFSPDGRTLITGGTKG